MSASLRSEDKDGRNRDTEVPNLDGVGLGGHPCPLINCLNSGKTLLWLVHTAYEHHPILALPRTPLPLLPPSQTRPRDQA